MGDAPPNRRPAGLPRRLAALCYDGLLVAAIAFVVTAALLPLTHGEAPPSAAGGLAGLARRIAWPLAAFGYLGGCWTCSGQTLGLRAWRARLETELGGRLGWPAAAARFLLGLAFFWLAAIGLWSLRAAAGPLATAGAVALLLPLVANFAWIAVDRDGRSLMDIAGRCRVVRSG